MKCDICGRYPSVEPGNDPVIKQYVMCKDCSKAFIPAAELRKLVEGSLEEAYWEFDAMRKGDGPYKGHPQAERDAYKMSVRGIISKLREGE